MIGNLTTRDDIFKELKRLRAMIDILKPDALSHESVSLKKQQEMDRLHKEFNAASKKFWEISGERDVECSRFLLERDGDWCCEYSDVLKWADSHPSADSIEKIIRLYDKAKEFHDRLSWYSDEERKTGIVDFIKSHWNDNETSQDTIKK